MHVCMQTLHVVLFVTTTLKLCHIYSWRALVEEAINLQNNGFSQEQLGRIMQVTLATGSYLTKKKAGNWQKIKELIY